MIEIENTERVDFIKSLDDNEFAILKEIRELNQGEELRVFRKGGFLYGEKSYKEIKMLKIVPSEV